MDSLPTNIGLLVMQVSQLQDTVGKLEQEKEVLQKKLEEILKDEKLFAKNRTTSAGHQA